MRVSLVTSADCAAFGLEFFEALRYLSADNGGVSRGGYSAAEDAAHTLLANYASRNGLTVSIDEACNTWVELPGIDSSADAIVIGSHLDSVRQGGNYDGAAGVVGGLAMLFRLQDTTQLRRPVRLVAFRGEEAAWFGTCYIGSRALVGTLESEMLDAVSPEYRISLREALQEAGADLGPIEANTALSASKSIHQYFEMHIEQGPLLVAADCPVGVVTGIRGNYRYPAITWLGEAGHSGAVSRNLRHDAVLGATEWLTTVERLWIDEEVAGADLVVTAGIFSTDPMHHAVTRIPDSVRMSLDIRSVDVSTLQRVSEQAMELASQIASRRGLEVLVGERVDTEPASIDTDTVSMIYDIALGLGYPAMKLPSGAGHDAAALGAAGIPIGMIFVRNENGSHNAQEALDIDDFCVGVDVLTEVTKRAAQ